VVHLINPDHVGGRPASRATRGCMASRQRRRVPGHVSRQDQRFKRHAISAEHGLNATRHAPAAKPWQARCRSVRGMDSGHVTISALSRCPCAAQDQTNCGRPDGMFAALPRVHSAEDKERTITAVLHRRGVNAQGILWRRPRGFERAALNSRIPAAGVSARCFLLTADNSGRI
jgi:hypothetical protein